LEALNIKQEYKTQNSDNYLLLFVKTEWEWLLVKVALACLVSASPYLAMAVSTKISTSSSDCQHWMGKGILCFYGFQMEEAIVCFREALVHDSQCAMAHYFIAYCYAANYNDPEGLDSCMAYDESQKSVELSTNSCISDWEKNLIQAQTSRFCSPAGSKSMAQLQESFAKAMKPVYQTFGEKNSDVAAIYAEALMMLRPWALWTSTPDITPAGLETLELMNVLEKALMEDPTHPGLCHFYIHTMELSHAPEKALPAADTLRTLYPSQGHLLHMPSHIDMWVGQYKEAIESNRKGVLSDEQYVQETGRDNEIYKMYRMHNLHFMVWASMFDGQFSLAMEYAEKAELQLDEAAVTSKVGDTPLGSMFLEAFGSVPWHVLVRFGKWEEIVARPLKNECLYPNTVATAHYARGIAYAVMGKSEMADKERQEFYSCLKMEALRKSYLFNNVMHDPENQRGILDVAEAVLNGEVEYHKGNYQDAFKYLRLAVERDSSLAYDEPWGWMTPARHVLGALLLERGEAKEAEAVYREDLNKNKKNLWSLLGLYQALKEQKKDEKEVSAVYYMFKEASVRSDIKIGASCLCATQMCCKP